MARAVIEAAAKQTGTDKRIDELIQDNVPKQYQEVVGNIGYIADSIQKQHVEVKVKWEW